MGLAKLFKTTRAAAKDWWILVACVVLSAAGILWALLVSHAPIDATRGAVLALGLTLAFVVGKSDSAAQVYEALRTIAKVTEEPAKDGDYALEIKRLKQRFTDLENQLKSSNTDEKQMNWYLVAATAVATIVSAFGDIFSTWIMHMVGIAPVK
jgi:hypothetical protein